MSDNRTPSQQPTLRQRLRHQLAWSAFNLGAPLYAWMTWERTFRDHCAAMADHFPAATAGRRLAVLDVGIGPGISGIGILDRRPDVWVVGVDFAHAMLEQARSYLQRARCSIELIRGDVTQLPFADASFDVVTHHSFLYLLANREAGLREMARVLRPGGVYVIFEPSADGNLLQLWTGGGAPRFLLAMTLWRMWSRGYGRFHAAQLADLLRAHGFGSVEITPTINGLGLLARAVRASG